MITFGELLHNFPQHVSFFMRVLDSRHAFIGCGQCRRDKRNTSVYIPTGASFGYLVVVSETYPRGADNRKAYCMWYEVPFDDSLPTRCFVYNHIDVSFSLRDDAPLVLSMFPGFFDARNEEIRILDCWLHLGYALTNVPYIQRLDLVRKFGFRPVSLQAEKNTSTWCVFKEFEKYAWIPSDTSFNLLVDDCKRVYSNQGDLLTSNHWNSVSRSVLDSLGDPIINLYVTACKTGHKIKLLHSRNRDRNILDVPSLFV